MKLKSLIKMLKGNKSLAIYTHNNPDPDCIASAYILKCIAKHFGVKAKIVYGGHLSRPENREMVDQLQIEVEAIDEKDTTTYDLYAIVDSQKDIGNNSFPAHITPDITFDHHESKVKKNNFYDINTSAGATSTIVLQYYLKLGLIPDLTMATSYCYALISETKDLDRGATSKDIRYFNKLYKYVDLKILSRIRHAKKPLAYYNTLKKALNNYKIEKNILHCMVGKVSSADYISEIADFLVNVKGIDFSIITGAYLDKNLVSSRTSIPDSNLGNILYRCVKKYGNAGGHDMIAAGQFKGDPSVIIEQFIRIVKKL